MSITILICLCKLFNATSVKKLTQLSEVLLLSQHQCGCHKEYISTD